MTEYKDRINAEINKASAEFKKKAGKDARPENIFGELQDRNIHSIRIKSDRIVIVERGEQDPTNRYAYFTRFLGEKDKEALSSMMEKKLGLRTEDMEENDKEGSFLWNLALFTDLFLNGNKDVEKRYIRLSSRPMNARDNDERGYLKEKLLDRICCKGTEIYEGFDVMNGSYEESPKRSDLKLKI